ncbi:MAG: tryptophan synthase subunit alpha [Vampirovibrionales bacterium]
MSSQASLVSTYQAQGRYARRFQQLQAEGRGAFIPFTLLGWPTLSHCQTILRTLVESQPAALELGLPFSDPIADGALIQQAVGETLATGFKIHQAFELIAYARRLDANVPIGLLVYYNTVLAQGGEAFFAQAKTAGVDAVLIADLPPEAAEEVAPFARAAGIELIFIVSPLTTTERLTAVCQVAGAFLYVVSRLGITGTESRYDPNLPQLLTAWKQQTALPLCVGFGISKPEHSQRMLELGADGTITGSQILAECQASLQTDPTGNTLAKDVGAYLHTMIQAHSRL